MNTYVSNTTCQEVADAINSASRVMLATHEKPDGDALGSVLALSRALHSLGKKSDIWLKGPVAQNLQAFIHPDECTHDLTTIPPEDHYDLIIIVDTGSRSQLNPIAEWLEERRDKVIVLDHHVNGDPELSGKRMVEVGCASATALLVQLFDAMEVPLNGGAFGIAEALFLGLATDSGWFKFSNADANAFRLAGRLLDAGADKARVYQLIEENDRRQRLALLARAVNSLQLVADQQAAVMCITPEDFHETGALPEDVTAIVNEPLRISGVRVSVLLTATERDRTKLSFRSKPPLQSATNDPPPVDVNILAQTFGGGGHVRAAGARIEQPLDQVKQMVLELLEQSLSSSTV